jgi:hypothetical protein
MTEGLITVATAQGTFAAELIKGRLESAGISVVLRYESVSRIYSLTLDGLGMIEIQVDAGSVERAREVLETEVPSDDDLDAIATDLGGNPGTP